MSNEKKPRKMHENSLKNLALSPRPGRPRKEHKIQLIVRLEATDLARLKRAAEAEASGVTASAYARGIILEALKR